MMIPEDSTTVEMVEANPPNNDGPSPHHVVGIGASAGGLEAIEKFFDFVPPDSGLSFVLVQHLSPDFRSLMDELLARHTVLTIHRVQDGMMLQPNCIYLIPPKKNMVLSGERFLLTDQDQKGGLNLPIDIFFRSLAQQVRTKAIGVVLSGTGSDGSRGIKEIHEVGGLVIVQDPDTAGFDGMPRAAIATGLADFVLAPELMAEKIVQYTRHPSQRIDPPTEVPSEDVLGILFALLRRKFGVDFSLYKPATIARRLERRMSLANTPTLNEYVRRVESDTEEFDSLYRDLLVEVTQFFRDREAFDILRQEVIPNLCANASPEDGIRVWVPACATGEEAYSIAMLFLEHASSHKISLDIKIFATDVHRASLDIASNGAYGEESIMEVPPNYLVRYFTRRGEKYYVTQEIRQMVIIAPHNLTKDPPFTKLDLISCRNALIYFNPQTQRKILTLFHFGLKTSGALFLGPSESVGELETEFETIDARWKLFRKRRDIRLPNVARLAAIQPANYTAQQTIDRLTGHRPDSRIPDVYEHLLHQFVPPSLLLNEHRELLHAFGDARKYLQVPEGKVTNDILRMVEDNLRMAISAAIHRATKESRQVVYSNIRVTRQGADQYVKMTVMPIADKRTRSTLYLVSLEEEVPLVAPAPEPFDYHGEAAERIHQLERELTFSKEHLQSTIEELESSNEELQSTNEELVASNEELQSTNEELHSVNEELYTVNAEHQRKIDELVQLTNDIDNLLQSTDIGTLFLDTSLNVRKFTTAIARIFNLLPQDVGRPLRHISSNISLTYEQLLDLIERTLATGIPHEQEVSCRDGEAFLLRVHPYLTHNRVITGTVLTFIDITATKESERRLSLNERRLSLAMEAGNICTWQWDLDTDILHPGPRFASFFGIEPQAFANRFDALVNMIHPEDQERFRSAFLNGLEQHQKLELDFRIPLANQQLRYANLRADIERDASGKPIHVDGVCIDISDRRQMQKALVESKQLLQAILDNTSSAIFAKDRNGRYLFMNKPFLELHELSETPTIGRNDAELFNPGSAAVHRTNDGIVLEKGQVFQSEELVTKNDGIHHYLMVKFPLRDSDGRIYGLGGVATEVTALKRAESEIRLALDRRDHFLAMLSHELRNPLGAILNAIHLMEDPKVTPEHAIEAREVIYRQAMQMARLLDDLLDVSRIAQNKIELRSATLDFTSIVREAILVMQRLFRDSSIELLIQLPEQSVYLVGDTARLQQAIVNLLTNAAKYTPNGGQVKLSLETTDTDAILSVADNGVGIAPEMLERIFDMFVQAHSTIDRRSGGIGVGLTLVRNIIELHGGSVSAQSEGFGKGSTFIMRLPLALPSRSLPVIAQPQASRQACHVVIVEDNDDSRRMLAMLLRLDGNRVDEAADGETGADMIIRDRPVIAFVDVGLPKMDGFQLARLVRERVPTSEMYLVALTGYGRPEDRRAVFDAGFNEHLVKPPRREELTEVMNRAMRAVGVPPQKTGG